MPFSALLDRVRKTLGHLTPVDVFDEDVDVLRTLDPVINHESVFPAIKRNQYVLINGQADVVFGDKISVQPVMPACCVSAKPSQGRTAPPP